MKEDTIITSLDRCTEADDIYIYTLREKTKRFIHSYVTSPTTESGISILTYLTRKIRSRLKYVYMRGYEDTQTSYPKKKLIMQFSNKYFIDAVCKDNFADIHFGNELIPTLSMMGNLKLQDLTSAEKYNLYETGNYGIYHSELTADIVDGLTPTETIVALPDENENLTKEEKNLYSRLDKEIEYANLRVSNLRKDKSLFKSTDELYVAAISDLINSSEGKSKELLEKIFLPMADQIRTSCMLNKRCRELNLITDISTLDKRDKEGAKELFKDRDILEKYNIRIVYKDKGDKDE